MGLTVFEIDTTTPHPGVIITGASAARETNGGWVTLRSSVPLTPDNRQWALRVLDHGEGNDGSGLMIGLLPRLQPSAVVNMGSRYVSELGGWCISRAGESYGSWRCDRIPFSSGQVVEFELDFAEKCLYIVCGREKVAAHIPTLADGEPLYPAFSMYYLNQKVSFV